MLDSKIQLSKSSDVNLKVKKKPKLSLIKKIIKRDWELYLLCLPALLYIAIFEYGSMYGVQIAFKDYLVGDGIWGSKWIGFDNFTRFFSSFQFWTLIRNTLGLSVYQLLAGFPIPIILALMLNHVKNQGFKKLIQTTTYAPHFISVVVLCGMMNVLLSPTTGVVNYILKSLGMEEIFFMGRADLFKSLFVWSDVWQNTGWGAIIYIAALSSVSPELYESAKIDGASKTHTILYIDLPSIYPTIVILFILRIGSIMNVGFQKAYLLQNPLNLETSEIIATYTYKIGLIQAQYSYSAAIGLFNSIINVILLVTVNTISKRLNETSLW